MAICDDCKVEYTPKAGDKGIYAFQEVTYGTCPDCEKTNSDGLIRTVARLEAQGRYAWPGGYPLVFIPADESGLLCFNCAKTDLENGDGPIACQVEDSDQKFYGGVTCDGCGDEIVEAECPECMNPLHDATPLLYADNVDASMIHASCARKLVAALVDAEEGNQYEGRAALLPYGGIVIVQAPWYAPTGTKYCPR